MVTFNHRRRGCGRVWLGIIAASSAAVLRAHGQAGSGDIDVSLVYVEKTQRFQQTSVNNVVAVTSPFSLNLGANARQLNSILSGQFRPPPNTGAFQTLNNDGAGNLSFSSGGFATAAALNAAFPNGSTYTFNLQTATVPLAYTASVPITGDAYPATAPRITAGTFSSGALQIDSTANFNFNWNAFSGTQSFQIVDASNKVVFTRTLSNTTGVAMAANTLQAGQYYTASLIYQTRTIVFQDTNTTWLATYSSQVDFKIATISGIPVITSPSSITTTVGLPFFYQIIATNHPISYSASPLPAGLTLDSTLGIISGTPTGSGTTSISLSASNIDGPGFAGVAPTVQSSPVAGPVITSSTSALAYTGKPLNFQVVTKGATSAARVSAAGLPAGLTIDSINGRITGTANATGSFLVNLTVTDGNFRVTGSLQLTLTADTAYPVITNANTVTVPRGQLFTYTIATPGATDPVDPPSYSLIGTLPQGFGFNAATGTISGTYTGPVANTVSDGVPNRPDQPELAGGALLGSVQLFGTNSHGTSTFQLLFLAVPSGAVNISTRLFVGTGENVLIGGFIVTGNAPKVVILRAMGPSTGIPGALQDPVLELHSGANVIINDNWRTGTPNQEQIIKDTTIPPPDDRESAIVIALDPGNYTAIVTGKNGTTGIALVEVFDLGTASLDSGSKAQLAQISTRGNVLTGDNVMIGGFIVSGVTTRVIARAIGPSLTKFGIANAMQDTTLDLFNGSGTNIGSNDDWRSTQEQAIKDTTVPPTDDRESAIVQSLAPSPYTAIVRGKGNTTGVALIEIYSLP